MPIPEPGRPPLESVPLSRPQVGEDREIQSLQPAMKTSHLVAVSATVFAVSTLPTPMLANTGGPSTSAIPSVPSGILSAYPSVVQTGTKPTLTWNILHPSKVGDVATIRPPGTITLTQEVFATIQLVGTGVTGATSPEGVAIPTEARVSLNGGTYNQVFYGTMANVNPSKALYVKKVFPNQTLNFGGSYVVNNAWSPFYTTKSANFQVVSLVAGQTPPTTFPLHLSSKLHPYLKPYLDSTGKVTIGPLSVLVLMELAKTTRSSSVFDLQDQVLLVTFSKKHPNNGHGNNLDGVDSSNPGNGSGGPNGRPDPSAGFDDEMSNPNPPSP